MLFEKYDLKPDDCVFITDTLGDILEAKKVNVRSIAVTFGFHDQERLKRGEPLHLVSDFAEIRPLLESILV